MGREFIRLGDIAEFINGVAFKPQDWIESGRRIIRIQNLTGQSTNYNRTERAVSERFYVYPGDLLVSWSATLGVYEWDGPDVGLLNQHIFRVLPDSSRVDKSYLKHILLKALEEMQRHLHGATMKHINRDKFLGTMVYLPSLPEQRRIADILDRADALRAKRRAAIDKLDELKQAIFLDMFGSHEKYDWPEVPLASLGVDKPNAIRTGPFGSQLLHSEFTNSGIAVLGIDNVVNNKFVWGLPRFITEEKYSSLKRYTVFPGDVLITIMGTCGRCAIVPDEIPTSINTKHLCCISLDQNRCLPTYLQACFLMHPKVLYGLGIHERGAVMPGLNMQIIKELKIPLPPISMQYQFAERIDAIDKMDGVSSRSLIELENLYSSLQAHFFKST